jgi:hypothetical protein
VLAYACTAQQRIVPVFDLHNKNLSTNKQYLDVTIFSQTISIRQKDTRYCI